MSIAVVAVKAHTYRYKKNFDLVVTKVLRYVEK